jgi:hypothetical protein
MAQNRRPPAYQEYAAEILAQIPFRSMSLQGRGLLFTLRLECWVNKQLPSDPETLAKVLGLPVDQVSGSLAEVLPFFIIKGDFIVCPELENYREHLDYINKMKSEGGKNSAAKKTKEKVNKSSKSTTNATTSNLQDTCSTLESNLQDNPKTLVKLSQVQSSKEKESISDSFVQEMDEYEATEENVSNNGTKEFMRF